MASVIHPRVLKGFRDFLPFSEINRKKIIRVLEDHFCSCGYEPIDTPALEYAEILLSKSGNETEKQTYRFTDQGGRDVALRFDLTVPFARFIATHYNKLPMPFKRYHIGKVWRGENTQRGRYREFVQCDFDTVGTDSASSDIEIMLMMNQTLCKIGAKDIQVRFSHRGLFNKLLATFNLVEKSTEVLRIVDKIRKIGPNEVQTQLSSLVGEKAAEILLEFVKPEKDNAATLDKIIRLADASNDSAAERIQTILQAAKQMNLENVLVLDPSITRGLDYYTGIVFETFLNSLPKLGSVCSGGRYDNLTGLFMKEPVSGVGASIGLDRLMVGLEELDGMEANPSTTDVLILMVEEQFLARYHMLAEQIRKAKFSTEVYPEARKFGNQFKYAETRNIPMALIVGSEEIEKGVVNLKDLQQRENFNGLSMEEAIQKISEICKKK